LCFAVIKEVQDHNTPVICIVPTGKRNQLGTYVELTSRNMCFSDKKNVIVGSWEKALPKIRGLIHREILMPTEDIGC